MDKHNYSNFSPTLRPIQVLKASLMKTSELLLLLSFFLCLITHLHIRPPWPKTGARSHEAERKYAEDLLQSVLVKSRQQSSSYFA